MSSHVAREERPDLEPARLFPSPRSEWLLSSCQATWGSELGFLGRALAIDRLLILEQPDQYGAGDKSAHVSPESDASRRACVGAERRESIEELLQEPEYDQGTGRNRQ